MQEIKHHIIGEFVEPWPVPWIGNLIQCLYPVSDTFVDSFSLYSASSSVLEFCEEELRQGRDREGNFLRFTIISC